MSKVIDKIKQNMQERKEKKEKKELIEKLKYMNDDELEEFVIKQIQKEKSSSYSHTNYRRTRKTTRNYITNKWWIN